MATPTGPRLNALRKRVEDWYVNERQKLIKVLETGVPYNARQLTTQEQVQKFVQMTPDQYEAMILQLTEKYRGLPNATTLVNRDLAQFVARMTTLMLNKGELSEEQLSTQQDEMTQQMTQYPPVGVR